MVAGIATMAQRLDLSLEIQLQGHVNYINSVLYDPSNEIYFTGSNDESIRAWAMREKGVAWPCHMQNVDSPVISLCFERESMLLMAGLASGTCLVFEVSSDFNKFHPKASLKGHSGQVNSVIVDTKIKLLLSGGADCAVQLYYTDNIRHFHSYKAAGEVLCMSLVSEESTLFIGCSNGSVAILSVGQSGAVEQRVLGGLHSTIKDLCFDPISRRLFTCGGDKAVVMTDTTKVEDASMKLHKHKAEVVSLTYVPRAKALLSLDSSGWIVAWDMTAKYQCPSKFQESDTCQLCSKPFFWNVRKQNVTLSSFQLQLPKFNTTRQHHCRMCGKAACADCLPHRVTLPVYGFEDSVYVCKVCQPQMAPEITQSKLRRCYCEGSTTLRWVPDTDLVLTTHKDFCARAYKFHYSKDDQSKAGNVELGDGGGDGAPHKSINFL